MKSINLLVAGALIISFSPIFVKLIELGPTWIAFWRATIAASFLFLFQFKLPNRANYKSFFKLSFLAGLTIALDLFVWHKSIKMIGAGLATVLGNTQVIYMVVFSIWIFKEPLTKKKTSSLLLAILGVLLISNIEIPSEVSSDQFYLGVVYGLLTGVA
ncbi:MAG: DMT family transporter, partial [Bdellovibrionales bacterium]|nr:DMT family transporter [Bdellovibrionales bacterium]